MHRICPQLTDVSPRVRRYLAAQAVSVTCSWATRFAVAWWIYRLSHSNWMLGLAAFLGQGFSLIVIPLAGSLADRLGRRRVYLATQIASAMQVAVLALLAWRGCTDVRWLLTLCAARGLIFALEQPARDGLAGDVGGSRSTREVVVLQSSLVQCARMAGPALAALLIRWRGEWACFALDAVSYLPVIFALCALRQERASERQRRWASDWRQELSAGWSAVRRTPECCQGVWLLAALSLLGLPLLTVLPAFARDALRGGPMMLSALLAASCTGALAANVLLARRRSADELEICLHPAFLATGLALMLISVAEHLALAVVAMALSGFAAMIQISGTNILLQARCMAAERGRVMAVYGAAIWGVAPLGSLLMGKVTAAFGLRPGLFAFGMSCLVIGQMGFVFAHAVRPLLADEKWAVTAVEESRYAGL